MDGRKGKEEERTAIKSLPTTIAAAKTTATATPGKICCATFTTIRPTQSTNKEVNGWPAAVKAPQWLTNGVFTCDMFGRWYDNYSHIPLDPILDNRSDHL
jgi:hypothetical protein